MDESPATIEKSEIITSDGKRTLRYMKALPSQQICLGCHGKSEQLSLEVKAKLKDLYPADQAIGYSDGQIRGALTVKRQL